MSTQRRRELINHIGQSRDSKVLAYVTGDRPPARVAMGDDAVRPIYDHLRGLGHVPRLDVFLYSRGGAIDVPWRLATAFRAVSDEWNIVIPFRANSSATLLALGADKIVLGRQGELGPIDPSMTLSRLVGDPNQNLGTVVQDTVSVEDVLAYVKFVADRAGPSDQAALATSLTKLTDRLDAVTLGSAYRSHSHIRDVARRMLLSRPGAGRGEVDGSREHLEDPHIAGQNSHERCKAGPLTDRRRPSLARPPQTAVWTQPAALGGTHTAIFASDRPGGRLMRNSNERGRAATSPGGIAVPNGGRDPRRRSHRVVVLPHPDGRPSGGSKSGIGVAVT